MSEYDSEYENLLTHMKFHHVKKWLLDGCRDEKANTIREAVERIHERRLRRILATALSED
jgi:hypothetical protein